MWSTWKGPLLCFLFWKKQTTCALVLVCTFALASIRPVQRARSITKPASSCGDATYPSMISLLVFSIQPATSSFWIAPLCLPPDYIKMQLPASSKVVLTSRTAIFKYIHKYISTAPKYLPHCTRLRLLYLNFENRTTSHTSNFSPSKPCCLHHPSHQTAHHTVQTSHLQSLVVSVILDAKICQQPITEINCKYSNTFFTSNSRSATYYPLLNISLRHLVS